MSFQERHKREFGAEVAFPACHVENRPGTAFALAYGAAQRNRTVQPEDSPMPAVTHVFWRDIPAQVIVGKGRRGSKAVLPERFEQAIDRVAMKIGAKDEDAYLAEWRRVPAGEIEGEPDDIAAAEVARLDADYDQTRLRALIDADGHDQTNAA